MKLVMNSMCFLWLCGQGRGFEEVLSGFTCKKIAIDICNNFSYNKIQNIKKGGVANELV